MSLVFLDFLPLVGGNLFLIIQIRINPLNVCTQTINIGKKSCRVDVESVEFKPHIGKRIWWNPQLFQLLAVGCVVLQRDKPVLRLHEFVNSEPSRLGN